MLIIQPLRAYALECLFIQLLRAYVLGCFNHPKLLRAHALECLVIQTRKMVPHAYCIICCRLCIVVVVVVGCRRCVIAWSMSSVELLLDEFKYVVIHEVCINIEVFC